MSVTLDQNAVLQFMRGSLQGYAIAQFPEFRPGRHHKLLASLLEDVEGGRVKRLAVLMAPRHGKSKLSSELFPSWYLGRNPSRRILSLSYGQDLADTFGRSVRNYLRSPTYGALFPDCTLAGDSNSVKRFNTTAGGGYATIGVGGATTGRGADLLLLDDLIKDREQADSPVYRENLIDWYRSVARTRLQPGGAIVVVQTRWGTTDFIAWLLSETAHEGWEVISLPALAIEDDPLGRQPGEALWPEAYPLPVLEQIRQTLGSRDWNALYQQCPISDADVIFQAKWLQFYDSPAHCEKVIHSWDLSFGGTSTNSSWVVGQVWGITGKRKYLLHMEREQLGFADTLAAIRAMDARHPASRILIEQAANGAAVLETLRSELGHRLIAVRPDGGKQDRAYAVVPQFERGEVWLPSPDSHLCVKPLLKEIDSFPMGNSDDCIDSMTQALRWIDRTMRNERRQSSSWAAYDFAGCLVSDNPRPSPYEAWRNQ